MESKNTERQFEAEVFRAELEEIRRRRATLAEKQGGKAELPPTDSAPGPELGLVGLSFSGGGIRSATFCLGVIQFLGNRGILNAVDYLSTVSGGGYIGSCLSSVLNRASAHSGLDTAPLHCERGRREPAALTHLRNSSKYLAPGGVLDQVRIPTLLLRGILVNLFLLVPYLILAVLLTECLYEYAYQYQLPVAILVQGSRGLAVLTFGLFVVLALTYPLAARLLGPRLSWSGRNAYERLFARALLMSLGFSALLLLFMVVREAVDHSWHEVVEWLRPAGVPELDDYWKWLLAVAFVAAFMLVGKASQAVAQWRARIFLYALGILAPAFLLAAYLLLCVWQIDSPFIGKKLAFSLDASATETLAEGSAGDPLRERFTEQGTGLSAQARVERWRGYWVVIDGQNAYLLFPTPQATDIYLADPTRLHQAGAVRGGEVRISTTAAGQLKVEPFVASIFDRGGSYLYGAGVALFVLNLLFVNVNVTSAHGFYRDRLSKAYLFQVDPEGAIVTNDDQLLSGLNHDGTTAPYHLINVALNLQGSADENLRGRNADIFVFSKRFIGSPRTGFVETEAMERVDLHLNLGTAFAISGAAAAPNMGTVTVKPLVPLLTLLNIRLGYWLPHPGSVAGASWLRRLRLRGGAGPAYLWKEARGRLDAQGKFVNVSDGGHIENLGIYELLRRRCRFIVAVDAEADPQMRFGGLLTAIRYAHIDLGIDIQVDLEGIRRGSNGFSTEHGVVGTIHYGDGEVGHLLYVKSSLTGDEEYVRDYYALHPEFPHEPTADQFFDEVQFEVYRWLGYHAAERLFEPGAGSGLELLTSVVEARG
jgi:hypothetical protein